MKLKSAFAKINSFFIFRELLFPWVILFTAILITRLPLLLSSNLLLDGDECVLGLMAKHLLEGKGIPVFFYGQNYGFSALEAGATALGFGVFGISAITQKITMLLLWSLGCLFLYRAAKGWFGKQTGLLSVALIIFLPAWIIHSTKALGGYITAFIFANIAMYILSILKTDGKNANILWFLSGICCTIVFYSQPIWLFGILPFLIYALIGNSRLSSVIFLLIGAIPSAVILYSLTLDNSSPYWPAPFAFALNSPNILLKLPERLNVFFSGAYYLSQQYYIGLFSRVSGITWTLIFFLLCAAQLVRLVLKKVYPAGLLALISILGIIFSTQIIKLSFYGHRYLLPLAEFLVTLLSFELVTSVNFHNNRKIYRQAVVMFLLITGFLSIFEFKKLTALSISADPLSRESEHLNKLISGLEGHNIHFVYCLDPMFQWNIIFYSKENILSRWFYPVDRYPEYPEAVDSAFSSGKPVALVGFYSQIGNIRPQINNSRVNIIDNRYFIYYNPDKTTLSESGFRFFDN